MATEQKYIPPQPPALDAPLFASSSNEAGRVAAKFSGIRYQQILSRLAIHLAFSRLPGISAATITRSQAGSAS